MTVFALHPQLQKDCLIIGDLPLCRALLMNHRRFPWIILVPRVENAKEIVDLDAPRRGMLMEEIAQASEAMQRHFKPHKLNVAALGNMVPQLHIHLIARFEDDAAWPNPVWNSGVAAEAYDAEEGRALAGELASLLIAKPGTNRQNAM